MRSDLLLFTLVASSILAVCPFPMNTLDGSSSFTVGTRKCLLVFVQFKAYFPTGNHTNTWHCAHIIRQVPKPSLTEGNTRNHTPKRKSLTKSIITRALRIKATPKYKGLYAPRDPEGRRWIYFTLTGWNGCGPCFGWKALGYTFKADGGKINEYGQVYIGISSGEPAHGRFNTRYEPPSPP
ncbi:hypothetical protein BDP27DRAFT_293036 [Rhodocollybia butyracea]|uniref:Secreted protein n=1 Tax=Rhodocollybia butyracea TaxID=206335 RepID=A0A9P5U1D6_9AGAR|nr:hypothetical protein BDP27DRAFT_293036 [Rhodocollybia butyracea]